MQRFSVEGIVAAALGAAVVLSVTVALLLGRVIDNLLTLWLVSLALVLPLALLLAHVLIAPVNRLFAALSSGVSRLRDGDFSTSIACARRDELGALVQVYNSLGDVLRRERQSLFQRELLLDTVIQATPLALVLTNQGDHVVYSNAAARRLFRAGRPLNGMQFSAAIGDVDEGFARAIGSRRDGLFTVDQDGEPHTYHLSQRDFALHGQPHRLYLFKQLTHELGRQEVATWKKVIRVISHELNNSLAPISSLAHSGALIVRRPDVARLEEIFATIEERSRHLKSFIEGYARFARLPAPRPETVHLRTFLESMRRTYGYTLELVQTPATLDFDPAQIEQVLINLLKNAHESGSPPQDVMLRASGWGTSIRFEVLDRGGGMSEQVLKSALLPFYSTKQSGTGLGLPLCREIVEAHGGRLAIGNRAGGGLVVSVTLPAVAVTAVDDGEEDSAQLG